MLMSIIRIGGVSSVYVSLEKPDHCRGLDAESHLKSKFLQVAVQPFRVGKTNQISIQYLKKGKKMAPPAFYYF